MGFSLEPGSASLALYLAGLAMPALAAIALSRGAERGPFLRSWLAPSRPRSVYLWAVLAQPLVIALAWSFSTLWDGDPSPTLALAPGFGLLAVGQLWVAFGEEPGWRGFALPRLERELSLRSATLVLACFWGVWHAPMFFVSGSLQAEASPWLFGASIFAWSAIHSALYRRARAGVLPNVVCHMSSNIALNLGLVVPALEPALLTAYLVVGTGVWATLGAPRR